MDKKSLIARLGGPAFLADRLSIPVASIYMWNYRDEIPARWRPTIWALLEARCPDVAATLDRDSFLGVRPLTGDAA